MVLLSNSVFVYFLLIKAPIKQALNDIRLQQLLNEILLGNLLEHFFKS